MHFTQRHQLISPELGIKGTPGLAVELLAHELLLAAHLLAGVCVMAVRES